jgi:bacterial/archaeal transporter family-2 protein
MDKGVAVALTALVGGLIALQAPINAGLARATGNFPAALVSFLIGTAILFVIVLLSGKASDVAQLSDVRWYYLLGGLLGAAYVFTVLVTVKYVGAGGVAAATITGQLTASVALDRLGVLGLEQVSLSPARVAGVCLLLLGTILIVR